MVAAARRVLGDGDVAAECASEAIAQVLARRPTGVLIAEAYMVTIAKRRAIDHVRASSRARSRYAARLADVDTRRRSTTSPALPGATV